MGDDNDTCVDDTNPSSHLAKLLYYTKGIVKIDKRAQKRRSKVLFVRLSIGSTGR